MRFIFCFSIFIFGSSNLFATGNSKISISFRELVAKAKGISLELRLDRLEALAKIADARSAYGALFPEVGVEGGARSNREKQKRNDLFYYGYARYELSLKEIFGLKSALARKDAAGLQKQQVISRFEKVLASLYYETLLLQESIRLKQADSELTGKQLENAKRRVDGGLATETDLLEFQMHQQEIKSDLEILDQEYQFKLQELARFSGISEPIESLTNELISLKTGLNFDSIWKIVEDSNLELKSARSESSASNADSLASLGEWMPRLSAEAQYGKLLETDFIESDKNSWAVIGKITVPLFSGFSSFNRYQAKSYEAEKANLRETQTRLHIRNITLNTVELIGRLQRKLDNEVKNSEIAERYYKSIISEYKRGVKNSPDMAGATDKLFNAKMRVIETGKDLSLATIELLSLQGKSIEDLT